MTASLAFTLAVVGGLLVRTLEHYAKLGHDADMRRPALFVTWIAGFATSCLVATVSALVGAADLARTAATWTAVTFATALVLVLAGCLPAPTAAPAEAACPCEDAWTAAYVAELRACPLVHPDVEASRECRADVERRFATRFCGRR